LNGMNKEDFYIPKDRKGVLPDMKNIYDDIYMFLILVELCIGLVTIRNRLSDVDDVGGMGGIFI